jgi:hypothetical protein
MFSCCTNNSAVVSDDVQVAQSSGPQGEAEEPTVPDLKPPPVAAAAPVGTGADKKVKKPDALPGEEAFLFHMERTTQQTPWGVDLTSDSGYSLTVVAVSPDGALGKCNATAVKPLKPGDVIVAIGDATSKVAMVEKLKQETLLAVDVVRNSKFEAHIVKNSPQESLNMDVTESNGKLLIQKIAPKSSGITRYNTDNYCTPLVEGDIITAVNGKDKVDEMINQIKNNVQFTLSVVRSQ